MTTSTASMNSTTSHTSTPEGYAGFDTMPLGGQWRAGSSGEIATDSDPYTGETLTEIGMATAADLDAAYRSAAAAQQEWSGAAPGERAAVLHRAATIMEQRREEILRWLTVEAGSTRTKAEWEFAITRADMLEAASFPNRIAGRILPASVAGKESRVYKRPVGVVGVISPWNFPLHLSNRSVAPALGCGNAVVLKPAGDTPVTGGLLLARIYQEAGLPPAALSVVIGRGSEIGDPMVAHPTPRLVSFTGSTPVGQGIAAKAGLKKLSLELGGNNPLLVLRDADLIPAVDAAIFGSYLHQGQICLALNRIIVDAAIHDEFVDLFRSRTRRLVAGDPREQGTQLGPIINPSQLQSIQDTIAQARTDGATLLEGGDPTGPTGRVLPAHVLTGGNHVATAAREVFGPVATIIPAADDDAAVRIANDTEYGLTSAVFSGDAERGVRVAHRLEAGSTHVGDMTVNYEPNTAFGGEKASGLGRFGGEWGIAEFTTDQWISVQHSPRAWEF